MNIYINQINLFKIVAYEGEINLNVLLFLFYRLIIIYNIGKIKINSFAIQSNIGSNHSEIDSSQS